MRASRLVLSSLERRDIVSIVIAGRVRIDFQRRVFGGEVSMIPKKKWKGYDTGAIYTSVPMSC